LNFDLWIYFSAQSFLYSWEFRDKMRHWVGKTDFIIQGIIEKISYNFLSIFKHKIKRKFDSLFFKMYFYFISWTSKHYSHVQSRHLRQLKKLTRWNEKYLTTHKKTSITYLLINLKYLLVPSSEIVIFGTTPYDINSNVGSCILDSWKSKKYSDTKISMDFLYF
jgi:hypothetical protein